MRMLVLGAAVSGSGAARLGRRSGHRVTVYDRRPEALATLEAEGFPTRSGAWSADLLEGVEVVVTSPGFPEHADPIRQALAARLPVWSEVELAYRHLEAPLVVAVTGTNGKTTVARLVGEMLAASGCKTVVAGNIGTALSEVVDEPWQVVVVEVSSFQLRFVDTFHAQVAVLLNVAPDHLDWHGSLESYTAAKRRVFARQDPDDLLIYDVDDPGAAWAVDGAPSRRVPVSGTRRPRGGWGPDGERLILPGLRLPLTRLARRDPAHLVDVAAAGAAASSAGASTEGLVEALQGFRPSPHRQAVVGSWKGVTWVDDSKATNPHAALASIAGHGSVILIAGGRSKGLDLEPLVEASNVRRVVAIGEAAEELVEAAGPGRVSVAGSMGEAVVEASRWARPGETVLLAPGCASFDMFASYAERGTVFQTAVRELHGEEEA